MSEGRIMLGPALEGLKVSSTGLVFEGISMVEELPSSSPVNGIAALHGVLTEPPELWLPGLDRESTNAGVPSLESTGSEGTGVGRLTGEAFRFDCFE